MKNETLNVKVVFLPPLSQTVGLQSRVFSLVKGATVSGLLEEVFSSYSSEFNKSSFIPNHLSIAVALNGKALSTMARRDHKLTDEDVIKIWIAMAGG